MYNQKSVKRFEIIKLIGKGGISEIYLIREINTKEIFAMKKNDNKKFNGQQISLLENEIKILSNVNHPNIIKLYAISKNPNNINDKSLVLEYCNGGSLQNNLDQYMSKYKKPFRKISTKNNEKYIIWSKISSRQRHNSSGGKIR